MNQKVGLCGKIINYTFWIQSIFTNGSGKNAINIDNNNKAQEMGVIRKFSNKKEQQDGIDNKRKSGQAQKTDKQTQQQTKEQQVALWEQKRRSNEKKKPNEEKTRTEATLRRNKRNMANSKTQQVKDDPANTH